MASGGGPRRRPGQGPGPPAPAGAVAGRRPANACRQGAEGGRVVSAVGDRPGSGFAQERRGGGRAAHRHAESFPAGLLGELRIGVGAEPGAAVGRGPRLFPCGAGAAARFQCSLQRPGRDPALAWAEWTRRSDCLEQASGSTPGICWHTTISPSLSTPRAGWTRRSTTSSRPSASTPNPPRLHNNLGMALRASWPAGRGHRTLAAKRQHRPQVCVRPGQSRHGAARQGTGGRGLRPHATSRQPRPQLRPRPRRIWPIVLRDRGRVAEAIDQLEQAVRLEGEKPTEDSEAARPLPYEAACADVQSAAGQGSEDARRGEPERAGKRRQALDWLRANLELTARLRKDGEVLDMVARHLAIRPCPGQRP